MTNNRFAENLKKLRLSRGLKQYQLADKIGVSHGIVSLWESKKREPVLSSLFAIARFFCVSLDELVGVCD